MVLTVVGKAKVAAHAVLFLVNILVLVFATRVNHFQEFFFMADLFPFGLSIVTLVLLGVTITIDLVVANSYTGRAQFEVLQLGLLSIFWLAFNAFSTSRWRMIPRRCGFILDDCPEEQAWCKDMLALRTLVWIEFLICFVTAFVTLRYALTQYARGYKHIFKMPLSRYRPELFSSSQFLPVGRNSEFLQFEKLT